MNFWIRGLAVVVSLTVIVGAAVLASQSREPQGGGDIALRETSSDFGLFGSNTHANDGMAPSLVRVDAENIVYVAGSAPLEPAGFARTVAGSFGRVEAHLASTGTAPAGAPRMTPITVINGRLNFEAGFPVAAGAELGAPAKGIAQKRTFKGYAVKAVHIGSYATLDRTYNAIQDYMSSSKLSPAAPAYEVYLNDALKTPEDQLRTEVYAPVTLKKAPGK